MAALNPPGRGSIEELGVLVCSLSSDSPFRVVDMNNMSADPEEKGLIASQKIPEDSILLSVDSKFFIGARNINPQVSKAIDNIGETVPDVDVFLLKMIVVLYECKNAQSRAEDEDVSPSNTIRATYFKTLPRLFPQMPINFTDEILDSFGPSFPLAHMVRNIQRQCTQALEILSKIDELNLSSQQAPLDAEFINWAVCCLNSRCFELKESTVKQCLVPFGDLLNHSFDPTLIHEIDENGTLIFRAAREINDGEELTINYQNVNDACSFLLHYGFNPWESDTKTKEIQAYFRVNFDPKEIGKGETVLSKAIESLGLSPSADMALPATLSQPMPPLWIWLLRLKGMTAAQRENFVRGQVEVTVQTEQAAWETIRMTLNDHKAWYEHFHASNIVGGADEDTHSEPQTDMHLLAQNIRTNALQVIQSALTQVPAQVQSN